MTNLGDSHRDGHRAGVKTKAMTIIGDFHQDGHRAGAKTKAMTNISNSRHGKNKNKALVLYSYEGPGKHVALSLRACETKLIFFQLYWLIELYTSHISLDCGKSV